MSKLLHPLYFGFTLLLISYVGLINSASAQSDAQPLVLTSVGPVHSLTSALLDGTPIEVMSVTAEAPTCLLYTSPSPRDRTRSRMPSSA